MADHDSLECMYVRISFIYPNVRAKLGIANVSEHLSSPTPNQDTFGEWNCMYNIVMMSKVDRSNNGSQRSWTMKIKTLTFRKSFQLRLGQSYLEMTPRRTTLSPSTFISKSRTLAFPARPKPTTTIPMTPAILISRYIKRNSIILLVSAI